jgi:hypothetical protein
MDFISISIGLESKFSKKNKTYGDKNFGTLTQGL